MAAVKTGATAVHLLLSVFMAAERAQRTSLYQATCRTPHHPLMASSSSSSSSSSRNHGSSRSSSSSMRPAQIWSAIHLALLK